ncbi:hypothetical protein AYK26_00140 [Euryarchaeota archaeon SM23-78]|nr:MAG: hypothetical protein AYK26_00140 [Euryarchaeota archaeon SM23-78]MBW3000513.1 hypothetical protein [Candidatus Woesearchaeota archaeon]
MRRGQAALEFLTTYGWAFIVILIMIGALAYFGVLNPSRTLPNKCLVEAGFHCKDFKIQNDSFSISLVNRKGDGLRSVNLTEVNSDAGGGITLADCTAATYTPQDANVQADATFTIFCEGLDFSASAGDKITIEFSADYALAKGTYAQKFSGSIFGAVQ